MPLTDIGKIPGNNVAAPLSRYAAPVPNPISVNMFGLRLTTDAQKRSKNGQPPQSTTGVASRNSTQFRVLGARCNPSDSPNIASKNTGSESVALTQNLSRMESYSGSASTSLDTSIGSRPMPQIGQVPGPNCTICGCMGQV